jgi:protocatechuate 3,4-dioxygenase beta subunit
VWILAGGAAVAQTAVPDAAVSGTVKDAGTGEPVPDYVVSTYTNVTWANGAIYMSPASKEVQSTSDAQGHYRLSGLPPGKYVLDARSAKGATPQRISKNITLAGHDLDGIDFRIVVPGTIAGRVIDENKEPVPGMRVHLISREYFLGVLGYFFRDSATTDDRGQYTLAGVPAGQPYLLLAEKRERALPADSEVPLNPKLRRRVPMRTWHPNSPSREGAAAVVVRPGERREGVDIDIRKSPSYCIEGTLEGPHGPAALHFEIDPLQPSSGASGGWVNIVFARAGADTGDDGKFRVCDLYPGTYQLTARETAALDPKQPANCASVLLAIGDQDIRDLKVALAPGLPLEGEVVWGGPAPEEPADAKVGVLLRSMSRYAPLPGEGMSAEPDIPGKFALQGLQMEDYAVLARLKAPGLYVKDVTYAGISVRHEPLRLGSAMRGAALRVIVARDGATLSARVADKDHNPLPDMWVTAMPADIKSEAMLAESLVSGRTDQAGQYTSDTLAPGKYYVAASAEPTDRTPESIGKLWRARNRFKEVDLPPNGAAQASLELVTID